MSLRSQGLRSSIHEKYSDLYTQFLIAQEKINILENNHGVKKKINVDISWFSIFNEFINSGNIEYTINKFDITLGDFIKACREAAEISQKVFTIYKIENFNRISQKFINTIIQKTML